jgi:teichuronic acid exporter
MDRQFAQAPARGVGIEEQIGASGNVEADSTGSPLHVQVGTLRRLAVRGGAYIISSRLIVQLFSWAITIVVARLLRPYDYGILTAAGTFTNLADILVEAGVCRALVQKREVSENDLAGAFTFTLLLSLAVFLTLFACAGIAARALQTPELVNVLRVTGLALLLVPFTAVPTAILERRLQLNRLTTIGLSYCIIQGCLVLTLVLCGWDYWGLIVGYMVPRVLNVLVLAWQTSWVPRLYWPAGWSNPLLSFGIHYTGSRLCWFCYRNVDYLIVGRLMGPIALGYYSLAFMLISLPVDKIVATCNQFAFPIFCRMSDDLERVRAWYLRLSILFGFAAVPALVGLALVANDAILVALGQKWTPAVLPVQIMSLAGVFMVLGSSIDVLYIARGRPDINFWFTAISVVVYPPLFYFCGLYFGITGVAMVWAVLYPIMVLLLIAATRSITGISVRDVLGCQVRIWVSVLFMALVVLATRSICQDVRVVSMRLGITVLAGVLGYVAAIRVFAWESVMGNVKPLWRELRSR